MGNMSYCRFQNTSHDLQDCIDALENYENDSEEGYKNLSKAEKDAADSMREQCETYIRLYDEATNAEEDEDCDATESDIY